MLHILLLILKIIGIIIAIILGILIVLLCIVLFVPVRYEIKALFDGKISTACASAEASWLLRLLGVEVQYKNGQMHWRIRVAWKVLVKDQKEEEGKVNDVEEEKSEKISETVEKKPKKPKEHEEESVDSKAEKAVKTDQEDASEISETVIKERARIPQKVEKPEAEPEEEHEQFKRESVKKRLGILEKLQNIYHKIIRTKETFCAKIKTLSEKKDKVVSFLQDENHKKAWTKIKKEGWKLLKRLWPGRVKVDIRYGFEDPSITGRILAGFSVIYPFVGESVHVHPDFEQSIIDGKLYIKGKIRIFTFIRTAWNLFWCRAVRRTYHDVRELEL